MAGPLEREVFEMIDRQVRGTDLALRAAVDGSTTATDAENISMLTEVFLALVDAVLRVAAEVDRLAGTGSVQPRQD